MYKMKANGVVFYDPSSDDAQYQVLSPKVKYELNKSDSLTFILPPGNVLREQGLLRRLKTIVTVEQDGTEIFRGRMLETASDLYGMMEVFCEGELSYLLDSLQRPYEYDGSAVEYFSTIINNHNEQVEEEKQFAVGLVTAVTDEDTVKIESVDYRETLSEIRSLLVNEFGGYLRVRHEDGVRYLDYVDDYDDNCGQALEFGVNIVDIEANYNAADVFSVLVPLGKQDNGKYTTIADVNGGLDYIEDEFAISAYGRIVKSITWEEISDPQELLEKGQEQLGLIREEHTIEIKAVDLHVIDTSVDRIRLGSMVMLKSFPHGLTEPDTCTKIELNLSKPEDSVYTFGLPMETLTDKNVSSSKKESKSANNGISGTWKSKSVVGGVKVEKSIIPALSVMLANGSTRTLNVVTSVEVTPRYTNIKYLGRS